MPGPRFVSHHCESRASWRNGVGRVIDLLALYLVFDFFNKNLHSAAQYAVKLLLFARRYIHGRWKNTQVTDDFFKVL